MGGDKHQAARHPCHHRHIRLSGCDLVEVTIPDSVRTIGLDAFANCFKLEKVTFGKGLTLIDEGAFYSCGELTAISIPDSVEKIGTMAFQFCEKLTDVYIGTGIKQIGADAFVECSALEMICYGGSEAEWAKVELEGGAAAIGYSSMSFKK